MAGYHRLCEAIAGKDLKLLRQSIGKDSQAALHWKPIMDAAYSAQPQMVTTLLKAGVDPDIVSGNANRHTPLVRVIERRTTIPKTKGHTEVVEVLLAAGADPNKAGGQHRLAPIGCAAIGGFEHFIEMLLKAGASMGFHLAAMLYDKALIKKSLEKMDVDTTDESNRTALHCLAFSGLYKQSERHLKDQLACAELLLKAGADVDAAERAGVEEAGFNATPLWRAVGWQGNEALAGYLLDRGANPDNAIFAASFEGTEKLLDLLTRFGVNVDHKVAGRTPLGDLMYYKRPAMASWLLEHDADPNSEDGTGKTPLHHAAANGVKVETLQLLLDHGADPTLKDHEGRTSLLVAVQKGRGKLVRLLQTL